MKIFYSFLIIVCATILILLPVTAGIYDFRTDLREDNFTSSTAVGSDNDTVQLFKAIYDDDVSTISITSNSVNDAPVQYSYTTATRALLVTGLTDNATRTLSVTYDVAAFAPGGLTAFLDILPYIWILIWVAFPLAAVAAIWLGKA